MGGSEAGLGRVGQVVSFEVICELAVDGLFQDFGGEGEKRDLAVGLEFLAVV